MNRSPEKSSVRSGFVRFVLALTVLIAVGVGMASAGCGSSGDPGDGGSPIPPEVDSTDYRAVPDNLLESTRQSAGELGPLRSLIIAQEGEILVEDYHRGMDAGTAANIKSASKTVLSALTGLALDRGAVDSLDDPIEEYLGDYLTNPSDERKRSITIRDLLLMRSGLRSTSFENYGPWVTSDNWVRHALARPLESEPGTSTSYSTGDSHLLSAVLTEALDRDLLAFANDHLFGPLDSRIRSWQRDPQGYRFGGNNMSLTPRSLLRFGQLYLNDGRHEGQQILPAEWIERSTEPRVNDTYRGYWYGYYWWLDRVDGTRVQFAWGYGGQYLFVVPAHELAVVITSDLRTDPPEDYNDQLRDLVIEDLVGSLD